MSETPPLWLDQLLVTRSGTPVSAPSDATCRSSTTPNPNPKLQSPNPHPPHTRDTHTKTGCRQLWIQEGGNKIASTPFSRGRALSLKEEREESWCPVSRPQTFCTRGLSRKSCARDDGRVRLNRLLAQGLRRRVILLRPFTAGTFQVLRNLHFNPLH